MTISEYIKKKGYKVYHITSDIVVLKAPSGPFFYHETCTMFSNPPNHPFFDWGKDYECRACGTKEFIDTIRLFKASYDGE